MPPPPTTRAPSTSISSGSTSSTPHSITLKVLRLSKPSLRTSSVLPSPPSSPGYDALQRASLAHPAQPPSSFPLTPLLALPPSFGAAYVGESFSCTLCANNERAAGDAVRVRDVEVGAELQTPSSSSPSDGDSGGGAGVQLEVRRAADAEDDGKDGVLGPGATKQYVVRHDLKEEGPHVLAVTVSYTEVAPSAPADDGTGVGAGAGQERKRTFRKLYQFNAQQAVGVRTKIGELRRAPAPITASGKGAEERAGRQRGKRFAVEAQVENLTEQTVVLDRVGLEVGRALGCVGLNGEAEGGGTLLAPGDVQQVAFRLDQVVGEEGRDGELLVEAGRYILAQLKVDWRMGMGQDGTLRTGWLGCLRR